jgi:signal transduction histidine kinase
MHDSSSSIAGRSPLDQAIINARIEIPKTLGSDPLPLPAEAIDLEKLVEHRLTISSHQTLGQAHSRFRECAADFFAVLDEETVLGLCARNRVGFILGSRYGFALYSDTPVGQALIPKPLFITEGTPIRAILEAAFARDGDAFYEDVILVDANQKLKGLIGARKLVQLQSRLVSDQFAELYRQHDATRKQNLELFQANNALRQSQALYQALFESHSLGVALLDVRGMLQTCNRRLTELLVFASDDVMPHRLVQRLQEHERHSFLAMLAAHEHNPERQPLVHEYALDIPGRGPRKFCVTTSWIQETGQISACFDDVTERRALENLMIRQEKQLLLDTMVGGIAHELNNKLTPVLGFAELLKLEKNQRIQNYAQNIGRSLEEAAHIIRQLLQLSKPISDQLALIDLRQVLQESLTMLKFQLCDSGCSVQTFAPASAVPVLADFAQLKQVVINLVINALQAMEGRPSPKIQMRIWATEKTACLSISDTGTGIPDEIIGRIFDPFFTTKGPDRGTGLGLSICTTILHLLGGDIAVESQPGTGSVFTVTLPLGSELSPGLLHPKSQSKAPFKSCALAQILAVDDEDVLRNVLQEMLHSCFNCSVDLAPNGAEALEAISRKHYDLIVSDIRMPVMSGPELYSRLKEMNHDAAKHFVFMTGHAGDKELETKIAEWGVPVIAKPFRLSRLSEVCFPYLVNTLPSRQTDIIYPS